MPIVLVAIAASAPPAGAVRASSDKQVQQPAPKPVSRLGERFNIGSPARSRGVNLRHSRISKVQVSAPPPAPSATPSPTPAPTPTPPAQSDPSLAPANTHSLNHLHNHGHNNGPLFGAGVVPFSSAIGVSYSPGYSYSQSLTGPIMGRYSPIDPNLVVYPPVDKNALPPSPPTAGELLSKRSYRAAGSLFRASLKAKPDDLDTQRLLAVALAGEGKLAAAAKLMERIYALAPEISGDPLDGKTLLGSGIELRRLVLRAVRHAQRAKNARSWLLVAVLIQAEGRDRVAKKMIDRAMMAGLDGQIVVAWPS